MAALAAAANKTTARNLRIRAPQKYEQNHDSPMHYPAIKNLARDLTMRPDSLKQKHGALRYFFGVFETFAAALTAGFLAGFSATSAIAFGLAADLAAVFGFFGAMSVSAVLAFGCRLGCRLASNLDAEALRQLWTWPSVF
jgi:hypothetical protein